MKRYLDIATHALVISAFMSLAFTSRLDLPSIAVFSAGVLWSCIVRFGNYRRILSHGPRFIYRLHFTVFFVADNFLISRSFVPATVHMVLFLLLVKLHLSKSERDYFYIIVLAFLMVLAAASLTVDLSIL
jgi:hypothetical protein